LTPPSLPILSKWLTEAAMGGRSEYRALVTIVNKWKGHTECVLTSRWTLDSLGIFKQVTYAYVPMPDKKR